MKFRKSAILLTIFFLGTAIMGGCKNQAENSPLDATSSLVPTVSGKIPDTGIHPNEKENDASGISGPINAEQLYTDVSLSGTVAEFTSNGCSVIPIITEEVEGGYTASQAAPGTEDKEKNVTVTYNNNCIFQIAVIDVQTGMAQLSDATKEDIKKQTDLMLYGNYQNTQHLNVSKVVIQRLEGVDSK